MSDMTPETILRLCKKHDLYTTPRLNDKLYLHHQAFGAIANLEPYVNLESLWLGCNGIADIENLSHLRRLRCLFLEQNCLTELGDGLRDLTSLVSLNLSHNYVTSLSGISHLVRLETLDLSHNRIASVVELRALKGLPRLTSLNLSNNLLGEDGYTDDEGRGENAPGAGAKDCGDDAVSASVSASAHLDTLARDPLTPLIEILRTLPSLRSVYLHGNAQITRQSNYRRRVIAALGAPRTHAEMAASENMAREAERLDAEDAVRTAAADQEGEQPFNEDIFKAYFPDDDASDASHQDDADADARGRTHDECGVATNEADVPDGAGSNVVAAPDDAATTTTANSAEHAAAAVDAVREKFPGLSYLDEAPVRDAEAALCAAFARGGKPAEEAERGRRAEAADEKRGEELERWNMRREDWRAAQRAQEGMDRRKWVEYSDESVLDGGDGNGKDENVAGNAADADFPTFEARKGVVVNLGGARDSIASVARHLSEAHLTEGDSGAADGRIEESQHSERTASGNSHTSVGVDTNEIDAVPELEFVPDAKLEY